MPLETESIENNGIEEIYSWDTDDPENTRRLCRQLSCSPQTQTGEITIVISLEEVDSVDTDDVLVVANSLIGMHIASHQY